MKKPLRMDRLAYRTIGLETIILDTKIGKEVHQLNEVASFVWNLCDGHHDIQNIVDKVCEEFEIDEAVATSDVQCLIVELDAKSLLSDKSL
jgi:methyltransferase-like protein